jgi:hypothetical protein
LELFGDGGETDLMPIAGWQSQAMLARYGASAADARAREAHHRLSLPGIGCRATSSFYSAQMALASSDRRSREARAYLSRICALIKA